MTCFFFLPGPAAYVISRNGFVITKRFLALNVVLFLDIIIVRLDWSWLPTVSIEAPADDGPVPFPGQVMLSDVVDFIYEHGAFPVQKARQAFQRSVPEVKAVGDNLEKAGILERGANNARVLSDGLDREKLDGILARMDVPVEQLSSTFVRDDAGYSSLSSALE